MPWLMLADKGVLFARGKRNRMAHLLSIGTTESPDYSFDTSGAALALFSVLFLLLGAND